MSGALHKRQLPFSCLLWRAINQPPLPSAADCPQVSVELSDPASSRFFAKPFSAPNATSSFDPLPQGTLRNGSGPLLSQFLSLAFDPYGTPNETAAADRTGITRLAFYSASGDAVSVSNLSTPITFTLPAVDLSSPNGSASSLDNRKQAVCTFWDERLKVFSGRGCAAQPNPLPRGLATSWVANISIRSDADVVRVRPSSIPIPVTAS